MGLFFHSILRANAYPAHNYFVYEKLNYLENMTHVILHSLLYKILILSMVVYLTKGGKFIEKYLGSEAKNYLVSTSNGTNHKLWHEYLEKRLEKISMYA